mmetsp:Transcript_23965/g.76949  ORF Transcript_23965/g.76949 Transcript_23965/m.76949 type:complete len:217 (-) Transcript_23965:303-953(-)
MSDPTIGMPCRLLSSMPRMDQYRLSHVAALSPVQCAVYLPDPTNVDRDSTKGRLPWMLTSASCVAMASPKPYKLCASYSCVPSMCTTSTSMARALSALCPRLLLILYGGLFTLRLVKWRRPSLRPGAATSGVTVAASSAGASLAQAPSQKLEASFMSIQMPSSGTWDRKVFSWSCQYARPASFRKSGKAVVPGQTLPMNRDPLAVLRKMFCFTPSS